MVGIKLQLCGHCGCPVADYFQARVQCLFILRAVHAYKLLIPSCATREDLGL